MCSCIAYKFVPLEIDETEGETSCVKHYFYVKDKFLSVMFGINFECRQCHKVFTRSAGWLSFLALIEIISFFFAVGYSIQSGIYWPFGVWGGFVVLCFYISYLLVPIQLKRDIHLKKFGFALTKRDLISLGLLCLLILVNSRMDRLIEIFKKILL
jgi:hypothetical protein